jgi:hypothetical protein
MAALNRTKMRFPMFAKRPFLWFQVGFLLIMGAVLLIGDRSQPRIVGAPSVLPVSQPLLITFDRPIRQSGIEKDVSLVSSDTGQAVAADVSVSSRSLALVPKASLAYGTTYTLSVSGITDLEGHAMGKAYVASLSTTAARFLYISPDYRLLEYDLGTRKSQQISLANQEVMGYSVSQSGSGLAMYYRFGTGPAYSYGLEYLAIAPDGGVSSRTVAYQGKGTVLSVAKVCNGGTQLLAYEGNLAKDGSVTSEYIAAYPLSKGGKVGSPKILVKDGQLSGDILYCSPVSDQFVYQDGQGNMALSSSPDTGQEQSLGRYQFLYGFTPKKDGVLLGQVAPQDPFPRAVYDVGSDGTRKTVSQQGIDSADPAYDPGENTLAVSEDMPNPDGNPDDPYAAFTHFQVSLYQAQVGGGVLRRTVTSFEDEYSNQSPAWSTDGRYLTYQHVLTAGHNYTGPSRPQDALGNYLDGEIMLVPLNTPGPFPSGQPIPQNLGIIGSSVQWLP